jgi:hypothetical protein
MSTKGLNRVATFALSFLSLAPLATYAQSAAPSARKQTTAAAKSLAKPAAIKPARPQLEPKAVEVLKAVANRLAQARTLSFEAVDTFEGLSTAGTSLTSARTFDVTLQRPNKLRVSLTGSSSRSEFYCNGTTMMTYSGAAKAVVIAKAPQTISDCLTEAYKATTISFPFPDLIIASPYNGLMQGLRRVDYTGQSALDDGTTADVVTYSTANASVQMWVSTEDKLPRMIHIAHPDDPHRVRHSLVLSSWRINVPVPAEVFATVSAANEVDAASPRPVGTSGVQSARRDQPLAVHSYSSKYWAPTVPVPGVPYFNYNYYYYGGQPVPYNGAAYYSSPDGYGVYPPGSYGGYYPSAIPGYTGAPYSNYQSGWAPEGAPIPGAPVVNDTDAGIANFNLSLSTPGWYNDYNGGGGATDYNPAAPTYTPGQPTYVPGQVVSTLPVGCAAPYTRGAAFYLCGNTWFSGVYGPDGKLYYRVVTVPGYGY